MKILIISGFLGAGKTTFIKELIRKTGESFVVLENEYGQTDVDEQILSKTDQADVWGLTEGCVCCTKSSDMISSVIAIENVISPEYLIVEPSGIGLLSNVIRNLRKIEYERITLLKPITIIDALGFSYDRQNFTDVYEDQIRTAGTVLISKPDHPDPEMVAEVAKAVEELNPDAELLSGHYTAQDPEWFRDLLRVTWSGEIAPIASDADVGLETCTIKGCSVSSPVEMLAILDNAIREKYGQVIRAKGILPAGKEWIRFDIAGGRICITGFSEEEDEGSGLDPDNAESVWIGRGLDRFALMELMNRESLVLRKTGGSGSRQDGPKKAGNLLKNLGKSRGTE